MIDRNELTDQVAKQIWRKYHFESWEDGDPVQQQLYWTIAAESVDAVIDELKRKNIFEVHK